MVAAVLDRVATDRDYAVGIRRRYAPQAWVLCSVALFVLVIALRLLLGRHPFPGDAWAGQVGAAPKPRLVYAITRVYQQVGRPLVAVGEVLLMLVWLGRSSGRRAAQGLFIALLASACCGLIKIICGPTPMWLSLDHVGTNFPSGVVTFVTAAGGYLCAVAWRQGRRGMPAVVLVVIAGAGPARVLGGQHLLSDVLGGYMLGSAWLIASCVYLVAPAFQPRRRAALQTETVNIAATTVGSSHQAGTPLFDSTSVAISAAATASAMRQSSPITNSQTNLNSASNRLT